MEYSFICLTLAINTNILIGYTKLYFKKNWFWWNPSTSREPTDEVAHRALKTVLKYVTNIIVSYIFIVPTVIKTRLFL